MMDCPNLAVPMEVMQHVVHVESSRNPFAIGVVGGRLQRQPRNLPEAVATANMLEQKGFNFSLGIAQVNRYNLQKYGLDSYVKAFTACPNLQAGSQILRECYERSGKDWGKAFSCYYSGNFVTGYREGYVQKIFASMRQMAGVPVPPAVETLAIPVIANAKSGKSVRRPLQQAYPALMPPDDSITAMTASTAGSVIEAKAAQPTTASPPVAPRDEKFVF